MPTKGAMKPLLDLGACRGTALALLVLACWLSSCQCQRYDWRGRRRYSQPRRPPQASRSDLLDPSPARSYGRPSQTPSALDAVGKPGRYESPSGVQPSEQEWRARNALADLISGALPHPSRPRPEPLIPRPDPLILHPDPTTTPPPTQSHFMQDDRTRETTTLERVLDQALARLFIRYVRTKQATTGKSGGDYIRGSLQLFRVLCQLLNQKDPGNTFCFSILSQPHPS